MLKIKKKGIPYLVKMKQRLYIDTSVFGGYFDIEFEEFTKPLFNRIRRCEFGIIYSDVTEEELIDAPNQVIKLVESIPANIAEFVTVNDESTDLAMEYIKERVVGKSSYADCMHIALATIHKADLLISWNFKHIVNVNRIRGYNSVNIKLGFPPLEIRSPRELINYED